MEVRVRDTPVSKSRPDSAHKELTFLRVIIKCPVLIERKSTEGDVQLPGKECAEKQ